MNDRDRIAWLYRRVGFGPAVGQLDLLDGRDPQSVLDELVDPDGHGVTPAPDPWEHLDFPGPNDDAALRDTRIRTVASWLAAMATTPRPFEEWMRWFWHGHFVSTLRVVRFPQLMVSQMRMFKEHGLGDFRTLLRAVTVDAAMLLYLDGVTNTKSEVNENYGREVLELFALGIGNYTEADVRAGSEALTGWRVAKNPTANDALVTFDPRRHDDRPKTYLGRTDVHDVDSVVDAIVASPACAPFITGKLARAILGPDVDDGLVRRLADDFAASGMQLRPLVRAILEAGVNHDAGRDLILAPVPWLVAMIKATGAPVDPSLRAVGPGGLVPSGQVPMDAPNVAGWPGGRAWLSSSATVARFDMAAGIANLVPPDSPARVAAVRGDVPALASALVRPRGFGDATTKALTDLHASDRTGNAVLTVAMAAPEAVVA